MNLFELNRAFTFSHKSGKQYRIACWPKLLEFVIIQAHDCMYITLFSHTNKIAMHTSFQSPQRKQASLDASASF